MKTLKQSCEWLYGCTLLSESLSWELCLDDSMMREEKKTHDHLRNTTQIIQVMLHLYFMEVQVVFMTRQTFINVEILS